MSSPLLPWKACIAAGLLAVAAPAGVAQAQSLGDVLGAIVRQPATGVSQTEAADGLRSALDLSAKTVAARLGRENGFFGDNRIRIPLPGNLARLQRSLKPIGLAGGLDELQLGLNRAAEGAMPAVGRLIGDAIRGITFQDALNILRGGDTAATQFLRSRTEKSLAGLLAPPMEQALSRSGAFTSLERLAGSLRVGNAAGISRADLTSFAVSKALDGAFGYIADEERSIRRDPAKRTTDLLRKVFGGGR